jgi:hypothetical protein
MQLRAPLLCLACLACLAGTVLAAEAPAAAGSPARAPARDDPAVQRSVAEDDNVRIEELRVRGVTQQLVVKSKIPGVRPYEIEPPAPGRDDTAARGSSGRRVWRVLSF